MDEATMVTMFRQAMLEDYAGGYRDVTAALADIPREAWDFRPAPGKWTIREIIVHLADAEAHAHVRVRSALAEPGKPVMAFDQDAWAERLGYGAMDAEDYLELFRLLNKLTSDLLRKTPEEAWSLTMDHSEAGVMTLNQFLGYFHSHATSHAEQIRRNYEAWKNRPE